MKRNYPGLGFGVLRALFMSAFSALAIFPAIPSASRLSVMNAQERGGRTTPTSPALKKTLPTRRISQSPGRNPRISRQSSCSAQSPTQATGRTHTVNVNSGVKLELVEIPAGSFCMGSANDDDIDEQPVHRVTIGRSFYMGKYEVTQAQWEAVMHNSPSRFRDCGGNCPVDQVSWNDAQSFINTLNQSNDGFIYRLPTESEWEYACRAGTTGDYAGDLDSMVWYEANSGSKTQPVGTKQPNGFGLYDMHGNVSEWCQDWHHDGYYGAPTDGSAWLSGRDQVLRVLRGGSWGDGAQELRSVARAGCKPDESCVVGFRVVAVART